MSTVAAATTSSSSESKKPKIMKKSPEEAVAGFNALRNEQRQIASKIYELDSDLSEHRIVMETLTGVDGTRKCFRMVGGVLVESTVTDVLPNLKNNSEQIRGMIESLNTKLIEKGKEILEYKEKYNIQFQVPEKIPEEDESKEESKSKESKPGVLT